MLTSLPDKAISIKIGATAIAFMAVCDIILLGHPVSGWYYDVASFGAAKDAHMLRAAIGAAGGAIFGFFSIPAYYYLTLKLTYINYAKAHIMCGAFVCMAFFNSVFHAGYFFLSENNITQQAFNKYVVFLLIICSLSALAMAAGTLYYIKLLQQARVNKWFYLLNPVIACGATLIMFTILPAPIGGYLKPTFINVGLLLWLWGFSRYIQKW